MVMGHELVTGNVVYLTAISEDDVRTFSSALMDMTVLRAMTDGPTMPVMPGHWYRDTLQPLTVRFGIHLRSDDQLIGAGGMADTGWQARHTRIFLFLNDMRYWSDGTAADTIRVLVRYAFMEMNLNRVYDYIPADNTWLLDALRDAGFVSEGKLRETFYRDGMLLDTILMAMLRRDWQES